MLEQVKALARALAAANGHPDPEAYAETVAGHFADQSAAPAAVDTSTAAPAPEAAPAA